jgi:hypothetical protein
MRTPITYWRNKIHRRWWTAQRHHVLRSAWIGKWKMQHMSGTRRVALETRESEFGGWRANKTANWRRYKIKKIMAQVVKNGWFERVSLHFKTMFCCHVLDKAVLTSVVLADEHRFWIWGQFVASIACLACLGMTHLTMGLGQYSLVKSPFDFLVFFVEVK